MKTIYMIGDSIMQTNMYDKYPQTGWGQVLPLFVKEDVKVINLAKNGTSTKSFIEQKRFDFIKENILENDLLIVGFAHNDEKIYDKDRYTDPNTSFKDNLRYFINIAKNKKANVILTTPIIRRNFINGILVDTHGEYVNSIIDVAKELNVTMVNLNKLTFDFYNLIGEEASKRYFMNFEKNMYDNYPNGSQDNSHQRYDGAFLISKLFVNQLYLEDKKEKDYFCSPSSPIICASDTYEK